jgi:AraC family transcriptional regulator
VNQPKQQAAAQPRFETGHFMLIAGLGGRFSVDATEGIPKLWDRFIPHIGKVPGQKGDLTYGVCCNPDGKGGFEYVAGVEISKLDDLPESYRWVEIQPQQYAVFTHQGGLDSLAQTFAYIWKSWLPASGREAADAPEFERYSADFDPQTGGGVLEIWVPLKAA